MREEKDGLKKNLCRNVTKHFMNLMTTLNPHVLKSSYLRHDKADHIKTHRNQIPETRVRKKNPRGKYTLNIGQKMRLSC